MSAADSSPGAGAERSSRDDSFSPSASRWAVIDALRGVAVLGVLTTHCAYAVPAVGLDWSRLLKTGRLGVDLFFVISGFVLCAAANRRAAAGLAVGWRELLWRRWLRLWPLYALGMVGYAWIWPDSGFLLGRRDDAGRWLSNLFLVNGWIPGRENSVVPGGWSISAETMWAVVFSCSWRWLRQPRIAWAGWGLVTLLITGLTPELRLWAASLWTSEAGPSGESYFAAEYLPTFLTGVLVWHAVASSPGRERTAGAARRPGGAIRWGAAAVALALVVGQGQLATADLWRGGVMGVAFGLLLFSVVAGPAEVRMRGLEWLGRHSYGAYLVHFAVLEIVEVLVVAWLPANTAVGVLYSALWLGTLALTCPAAWLAEMAVSPRLWRPVIERLRGARNLAR